MTNVHYLQNGITIVLEPMNYLRSVSIGVWIRTGSVDEDERNNGISHVIEHMMFKGTKNRTAKQLAEDMSELGGNMNAYTSKENTTFYVTTLDSYLEKAVDILSDMLCNSLFLEKDIKKELEVVMEEIDMYHDSPEDLVYEMLQKEVWKGHSLGYIISGEKEIVSKFTREQIVSYWKEHYIAEKMVISIAGNIKEQQTIELLNKAFITIPTKIEEKQKMNLEQRYHFRMPSYKKPMYSVCKYQKKMDIEQVHMNLCFPCIDYYSEERYPLSILNAILGGSENSRLFQRIREEKGLVYSIYSYESMFATTGLFHIDVVLNPCKYKIVLDEIMQVIKELKEHGVTKEEIHRVKEQIKVELIIGTESTRNRMDGNGRSILRRGKIIPIDETIDAINQVTEEQIMIFLNKYIQEEKCSISLVGNLPIEISEI